MAAPARCFDLTPEACFFESYFTLQHPDRAPCDSIVALSSDNSLDRKHWVGWIEGTTVHLEFRDHALNQFATSDPGISATGLCVRFDRGAGVQKLFLWTIEGGALYFRESSTGLPGFGGSTLVSGAADAVTACVGQNRLRYVYWLDGTDIKGRRYDAAGNAIEAAFVAISGVDAVAPSATCWPQGGGKHQVVLDYESGGVKVFKVSADGVTFP